jgi:lipoate---protein ligase
MIQLVHAKLPDVPHHLACDEVLLELCDSGELGATLRFWSSDRSCVVLGLGNDLDREVDLEACRVEGVPVFRRCTGGGAVVQGRGCLNYSLVLPLSESPELANVLSANAFIMERNRAAVSAALGCSVEVCGCTDLALNGLKFSGNAQRRRRSALLFHGTFLLEFDLPSVSRLLHLPVRQPKYREGRKHEAFLMNLKLPGERISAEVSAAWKAVDSDLKISVEEVRERASKWASDPRWRCFAG